MSISPCRLAEAGLVTEGAVRLAPLLGLPRLLVDHGVDADAFIRGAGCDPALFRNPENTIDFAAVGRLLVRTAAFTGNPYPGLELGSRLGLGVFGVLGEALRLAPDLGTALRTLMLHFHLHDRGAVPSLWESHDRALFGYTLFCPDVPGTDHIYDTALVISRNIFSELVGRQWKMTEVQMFREPPAEMEPFRRCFRTPLRFGAEHAAIVFPAADLVRPLPRANPTAYARALRDLESMEGASDARMFCNKVRRLLNRMLISGPAPGSIDLRGIAQLFTIHPRTLNRRLRAEGTTFSALLAEARFKIARQLLRDTRLQTTEIAYILGYAGTASFDHAFRRWSGTTATKWRSSNRSD
jgi:AraC-like DNA-binding protein